MPVLHHFLKREGAYVKAWINGSIVTLQLTEQGLERLQEADLADGSKFPLSWLIDLIHDREAFTKEGDPSAKAGRHEAEQFVFDFEEDEEAQKALPVCEETSSFDDLHLVVYGAPFEPHAQLLGPEARGVAQKVTLSVPLNLLTARDLDRLIDSGKLPEEAPCVKRLREFFSRLREEHWGKLADPGAKQAQLELEEEFRLR